MRQQYDSYKAEDMKVWKILFDRQFDNLQDKSSLIYLDSLDELKHALNAEVIPNFDDLNRSLMYKNGWSIEVVKGLIPVDEFFKLLAQKKFCASTWLRSMEQLDYLDEPDMFHDIFGHIPLLMNEDFSNFAEGIGKIALKHLDNEEVLIKLQRIYWFTIEFGLINENNELKCYGAGIMSSFGETNHIYDDAILIHPFDIEKVINKTFTSTEIQDEYVMIERYSDLFESLQKLEHLL
jgi:phenylalanine-4-hydroxylase